MLDLFDSFQKLNQGLALRHLWSESKLRLYHLHHRHQVQQHVGPLKELLDQVHFERVAIIHQFSRLYSCAWSWYHSFVWLCIYLSLKYITIYLKLSVIYSSYIKNTVPPCCRRSIGWLHLSPKEDESTRNSFDESWDCQSVRESGRCNGIRQTGRMRHDKLPQTRVLLIRWKARKFMPLANWVQKLRKVATCWLMANFMYTWSDQSKRALSLRFQLKQRWRNSQKGPKQSCARFSQYRYPTRIWKFGLFDQLCGKESWWFRLCCSSDVKFTDLVKWWAPPSNISNKWRMHQILVVRNWHRNRSSKWWKPLVISNRNIAWSQGILVGDTCPNFQHTCVFPLGFFVDCNLSVELLQCWSSVVCFCSTGGEWQSALANRFTWGKPSNTGRSRRSVSERVGNNRTAHAWGPTSPKRPARSYHLCHPKPTKILLAPMSNC